MLTLKTLAVWIRLEKENERDDGILRQTKKNGVVLPLPIPPAKKLRKSLASFSKQISDVANLVELRSQVLDWRVLSFDPGWGHNSFF